MRSRPMVLPPGWSLVDDCRRVARVEDLFVAIDEALTATAVETSRLALGRRCRAALPFLPLPRELPFELVNPLAQA